MPRIRNFGPVVRDAEFIISESSPGRRSREQIIIDSAAGRVPAGTVLAKQPSGRYLPYAVGGPAPNAFNEATEPATDPATHRRTAGLVRDAEVNGHKIFWPAGITAGEKAAAEALLANEGLLVRY